PGRPSPQAPRPGGLRLNGTAGCFLAGGAGGHPHQTTLTRIPPRPLVRGHETTVFRFVRAQKIRVWRGCPQPLPHAVSTPLQDKSRRGLPRFSWREPGGAGGTSPVDPYLLRAAEARNQDLVARERAESGMRGSVV